MRSAGKSSSRSSFPARDVWLPATPTHTPISRKAVRLGRTSGYWFAAPLLARLDLGPDGTAALSAAGKRNGPSCEAGLYLVYLSTAYRWKPTTS
jgi:hypothetical protein